jgi:hypothetical protein
MVFDMGFETSEYFLYLHSHVIQKPSQGCDCQAAQHAYNQASEMSLLKPQG